MEHSLRVANYCSDLGRHFGLDEDLMFNIGINHDVGKIFIPTRILKKDTFLKPFERELIDMHAYFGYRILKDSGYAREVCIPVLYHHGFDKPKASPIEEKVFTQKELLCTNIITIADVFDALTSKRSYHPPKSREEAFEIMTQEENINKEIFEEIIKNSIL